MIDIGSEITFIRRTKEDATAEGQGIVKAIFLNPDNRKAVQVVYKNAEGKDETQNILWEAINPSDEFKEQFKALVEEVKAIAAEGNSKVAELVAEYNKKVEAAEAHLFGKPIIFEV